MAFAQSGQDSVTYTPVSLCKVSRLDASGSLDEMAADVVVAARNIPWIRAVAIRPAPMKPQRSGDDFVSDILDPRERNLTSLCDERFDPYLT